MKKYLYSFLALGSTLLLAAEGAETEIAEEASLTVKDIIIRGGGVMYAIVGLSVIALILIIYYMMTLRAKFIYPRNFIIACKEAAEKGDLETLRELCAENSSPASAVISAAVEQCSSGTLSYDMMRDIMEDEGSRQANTLWQKIQYLMDIAVISPMVGLLGTVWGMMISFSGLESGLNIINKADTLANGVSQAMFTTFGGLIVGITCMAFHAFLRGHVNKLISGLEAACSDVLRPLRKK